MDRKVISRVSRSPIHKRIAFVCFSRSLGGLELTTLRLAKAMRERGHVALVIVPTSSPLQRRAMEMGISVDALEPRWKYGDLVAAIRLGQVFRKNRIDVVVLVQSKDIHVASLASVMSANTKLVFYQQMD